MCLNPKTNTKLAHLSNVPKVTTTFLMPFTPPPPHTKFIIKKIIQYFFFTLTTLKTLVGIYI
jgi:hypothetical protein